MSEQGWSVSNIDEFVDGLKYDDKGLMTAVMQDWQNHEVLMVGYMNKEAVKKTLVGPYATFYSRSRQKMWIKGESSGHTQIVKEVFFDCDRDCLLIKIEQNVAACHEGFRSCFFRRFENSTIKTIGKPVFDKGHIYK